jgi:hypothetical protein
VLASTANVAVAIGAARRVDAKVMLAPGFGLAAL